MQIEIRWLGRRGIAAALALALAAAAWLAEGPARAGGLYTNEYSTSSQGNAGAGSGAWEKDASAALFNPAAMTRLDDHAFSTGFSAAFGKVRFDADSDTPRGGGNGGNQAGVAPIASANYVHKISDRFRFGLTFFSLSGSILDPSNDWAGRFQMTKVSLLTISIAPSLAFKVTDWLSIGGGPIASYGKLDWNLRFGRLEERNLRLDGLDDWAPAGRVGVLLTPIESLSFSIYYQSETDFHLKGDLDAPRNLTTDLNAELPLPQLVYVAAAWQVTERLTLLASFDWENWNEADKLSVDIGNFSVEATTGFRDTYKFGLGANWKLRDDWMLQTGVAVDTSPLHNRDRTVALPLDRQIRAAVGVQHDLSESTQLGFSFVYINFGQGTVRQRTVRGDYQDNHIFVFGMNLNFGRLPWAGKATL